MRTPSRPSTAHQRGFTLLELLVVMSLLSLVMIGLVSALRTMAQTENKIDQRLQRLDEIRVARTFLQQTLSRVSGLIVDEPGATGKRIVPFIATPDSLTWVGIMPARANLGGRHFFRLAIKEDGADHQLVLQFSPWKPDMVVADWSSAESRVLIRDIEKIHIQAQGLPAQGRSATEPWPQGWQEGWPIRDSLPERVRLGLVDTQGDWPEWVVQLRALPQGDYSDSRVTVGGGAATR